MNQLRRLFRLISIARKNDKLQFALVKRHPMDRLWIRILILALLTVSLVSMFPSQRAMQFADFKEGSISPRRIIAPFSFEILKTQEEYQLDRERARKEVKPVFNRNEAAANTQIRQLARFFEQIRDARHRTERDGRLLPVLQDSIRKEHNLTGLETQTWDLLIHPQKRISNQDLNILSQNVERLIRDLMSVGILNQEKNRIMVPDRHIIINEKNNEVMALVDDFLDMSETRSQAMERMNRNFPRNAVLAQTGYQLATFFIRPNVILDEEIYHQRVEDALARVPLSQGFVIEEEKIVDKNERITPEIRKKLVSLSTKMAEMGMQQGGFGMVLPYFGKGCFVLAFLILLGIYIHFKSPSILTDTKSIFMMALILILVCFSTYLISNVIQQEDRSVPFITTAIGAMLLAMIFDEKIGYVGVAVMSVFVGGILGNDFNAMVVSFFTGIIGIVVIKRLRNRSQLLQATLAMIAAYIFIFSATGLMRFVSAEELRYQIQVAVMTGIATPFLAYVVLSMLERLFDITTDYRLLELSNLSHELMKRLSVEATGTYHHSIQVGNLAEAAAQAVRANSLLARVGSYYHDIGKLEKAEYFVENQRVGENPHLKLTPRMSALILANHVKKSLELADQYGLPSTIKDIMVQHHGTTVMAYFYRKAMAKNNTDDVNENDYKYPGPKPQSKEAAIVMLADSIEAATRALKNPTHSRLKGVVEDIVDERFKEGELDESPLTLRDLERIKEAFLNILAGIFHTRIEYPDREDSKEENGTEDAPKDED
ncbi:HDIG domain-containing protein [bacterium]|nr:HDIG domain-containing protein [bacterium]